MAQLTQHRAQIEIMERGHGRVVYKEVEGDTVRLVTMYGEDYMWAIELKGDTLRAYEKWIDQEGEVEKLVIGVRLKPRFAAKLRKYLTLRVNNTTALSLLWFELERGVVFLSPKGAEIKFWRLDLDEPERQKKPITRILSRLKSLFS